MQHKQCETRGERNARWMEKYCLYPNGPGLKTVRRIDGERERP